MDFREISTREHLLRLYRDHGCGTDKERIGLLLDLSRVAIGPVFCGDGEAERREADATTLVVLESEVLSGRWRARP